MSVPSPSPELTAWLRALPAQRGVAPTLDTSALPDAPEPLFEEWIRAAVDDGVAEAHAATLATVDERGLPDARTLILKSVDERGWAFASTRESRKGAQLAARSAAALNFWWQPVVRAVRVRGRVEEASREESAADLAARSPAAREAVGADEWVLWRVVPERIEFWQGARDRHHTRIVYTRDGGAWSHTVAQD